MKTRLFLILLLFSFGSHAQDGIVYGNMLYQKYFLGQVNTLKNYEIGRPVQFIGIDARLKVNKKYDYCYFVAAQFLPQDFRLSDSVSGKISGSLFGFALTKDFFAKVDAFDLCIGGGLNIGRMKLVKNDDGLLHHKNMFISPKICLKMTINVGGFSLTAGAEYAYDVSGSQWKEKVFPTGKRSTVPVPGFNQSGLNFTVGLGWDGRVD